MNVVEQLRERINAKHREAIKTLESLSPEAVNALETLVVYLTEPASNGVAPAPQTPSTPLAPPPARSGHATKRLSFRDTVLAVIGSEWATVDVIVQKTGLTVPRVRGVVNAPTLANMIKRRETSDGKREYRYEAEDGSVK